MCVVSFCRSLWLVFLVTHNSRVLISLWLHWSHCVRVAEWRQKLWSGSILTSLTVKVSATRSGKFYSDLRNARSLELTRYYCVNCHWSMVTMVTMVTMLIEYEQLCDLECK